MRPPVGLNDEEQLAPIEGLLRSVAEFEPDEPAPGLLTAGGVALLLAEDAASRRRTVRARMTAFAGALTGMAACSASLVMALNQPVPRVQTTRPVPVQVSQRVTATEPAEAEVAVSPPAAPKGRVSRGKLTRRVRHRRPIARRPEAPAPPVWTEETVERQVTGVLAQAWLVQPQEDGSFEVTPTLVDVSLPPGPAACDPDGDASSAAPATEAPAADLNLEDNEAR